MIRKFECKSCGHHFDADDINAVICPHCKSDNVEYAKFHLPRWLLWIVLTLIVAGGIGCWLMQNTPEEKNTQPDILIKDSIEQEQTRVADSLYVIEGNTIQPSLTVAEKAYNDEDDTYSCRIVVLNPPQQSWKVVVRQRHGGLVAESEDGRFVKLPYSKDDGFYLISLVDKSTGKPLCEEREIAEFPKLDVVKRPWNEAGLEKALKGSAALVDTPFIANPHKVIVVNKLKGDESPTKTLRDIQRLVKDRGLNVKVEKVEHDKMKKIIVARIKIDYPNDWLPVDDD